MTTSAEEATSPDPPYDVPAYVSTRLRVPKQPLVVAPSAFADASQPLFGEHDLATSDGDLTRQFDGEPLGERIVVNGLVLDGEGRPVRETLIEIWQPNAAGRYRHDLEWHPAPLDPNFAGAGRVLTDSDGYYCFTTIKPGAYPWKNHPNAWRPAHIHFSVFGRAFANRLVTQMYFPGDPLLDPDPIFNSIRDERARQRLVSDFDWSATKPEWALGYRFDIVLRGPAQTPFEE
jgi:protocatechuate 3,4-dioxygenase, beta subunit